MELSEETSEKIQELKILEQNLQAFLSQKQMSESELGEISNALSELKKYEGEPYRILSGIMIKTNKDSLIKELEEKKKILELRISSIEKQEKILSEKAETSRKSISELIKKQEKK